MSGNSGELLAAALSYVERGWRVMPLHTGLVGSCSCGQARCVVKQAEGKHPRHAGWQDVASSDPAEVERWWTRWPTANVGVLARASGLVVVDVDPRNGGDESLAALEAAYEPLPSTLTAATGGGGWHYLFRHPGCELGRRLADGVDLQAGTQLFVAAPSLHRSGSRYEWVDESAEVVELPGWIVDKARSDDRRPSLHVVSRSGGGAAPKLPPAGLVPDQVPPKVTAVLGDRTRPRQYRVYTAAMVAARAGLTRSEYVACVRSSSDCARWVAEEGPEALARQVENAYRKVADQGSFVDDVWTHAAAADAAPDQWVGRDGRRAYLLLWNLRRRALDMGGGKFPASVRDLAEVGPVSSRSAVQRTMPTLEEAGWVRVVERSRPGQLTADGQGVATVYRLTIPSPFRGQGHNRDSGVSLGYVPASGKLGDVAVLMGHDAVRREGLGVRADTFRLLLVHGPRTVGQLRKLTGLGSSAQYEHLNRLQRFGLVAKDGDRWAPVEGWSGLLDGIAERTGAREASERRRERIEAERSLFRGWVAEREPASWCRVCGVGLYVAGVDRCAPDCVGPKEADTHAEELLDDLALDLVAS